MDKKFYFFYSAEMLVRNYEAGHTKAGYCSGIYCQSSSDPVLAFKEIAKTISNDYSIDENSINITAFNRV